MLLETRPSEEEFWSYWAEREDAVVKLALSTDQPVVDAGFERLFAIAESKGYARLPRDTAQEYAARFKLESKRRMGDISS